MADPVSGPLTREQLKELANAPYGEATKAIRKIDPLWAAADGAPIKWRVTFTREITERGFAIVEAATKEEAEEIAEDLPDLAVSHDDYDDCESWSIDDVEPAK